MFINKIYWSVIWVLCCSLSNALAGPVPEATWQQVKSLSGISTKSASRKPSLYIFFDPNCPYCADLWLMSLPQGGQFRDADAKWIPVSYLNSTSVGKAAALLRSAQSSVLDANFRQFNREYRQGGVQAVAPNEAELLALGKAKAVWMKLGGMTPMFVYRTRQGDVESFLGLPEASQVGTLMGNVASPQLSEYKN